MRYYWNLRNAGSGIFKTEQKKSSEMTLNFNAAALVLRILQHSLMYFRGTACAPDWLTE